MIKKGNFMVTEVIEDPHLLDVLRNAIEFEETKAKQKTCYYCGEKSQIQNSDIVKTEEIPDQWICSNGHTITSRGWEWYDITGNYLLVQRLLRLDIAKIKFKSNKHTEYCLSNREYASKLVKNSLYSRLENKSSDELIIIPNDLFANIMGYEEIKKLLQRVILSSNPLHVLFVGPPSSAKTLFQLEIERLPGTFFLDGANITRAGLTDLLFSYEIRYLIIDEMEEMGQNDVAALTSFMQTEQLSETKYGRIRTKTMKTCVIGSCNNTSRLAKKLISRFLCLKFNEYSYTEFLEICRFILSRQNKEVVLSEKIANMVWNDLKSKDIRDVLKISSLTQNNDDLEWIIKTIQSK